MKRKLKSFCITAIIIFCCVAQMLMPPSVSATLDALETAADIFCNCSLSASCRSAVGYLRDGEMYTHAHLRFPGVQYWDIRANEDSIQGIYIRWGEMPKKLLLCFDTGKGYGQMLEYTPQGCYQEYIELPEGTVAFRLGTPDGTQYPLCILEMNVYSDGILPESVHLWSPTPSSAELMVVSTHQDDELLFFGGTLPYYAGEKMLDTVVVYMSVGERERIQEAMEGLWVCGVRQNPIFIENPDVLVMSMENALLFWDRQEVTDTLTDLLCRYRPQVVVSHDESGEYGHGQHILTVSCLEQAILDAASGKNGEIWDVPKCYLHLHEKDNISMPWDKLTLERLGGMTALDTAMLAMNEHYSQRQYAYSVSTDEYDCRSFGLWRTTVGADVVQQDFFENIVLRIENGKPPDVVHHALSVTKNSPYLFKVGLETGVTAEWLRYGTIGGITGWYEADTTGVPVYPARQIALIADMPIPSAIIDNIMITEASVGLYEYRATAASEPIFVRYGTVDGVTGWFAAEKDATLVVPVQMVSLSAVSEADESVTPSVAFSESKWTIGSGVLLAMSAIMLVCYLIVRHRRR